MSPTRFLALSIVAVIVGLAAVACSVETPTATPTTPATASATVAAKSSGAMKSASCGDVPWEGHRAHSEYLMLRALPSPDRMLSLQYQLYYARHGRDLAGRPRAEVIYRGRSGHVLALIVGVETSEANAGQAALGTRAALKTSKGVPDSE